MNTKYKPLEESLTVLESCARKGDRRGFENESTNFYKWIPRLEGLSNFIQGTSIVDLVKHYQTRYDRIKLILPQKR